MTRMTWFAVALVTAAALLPVVADAQPVQGLYVNLGAGANLAGDPLSAHETTNVYTTVGPVGLVDLGWGFGNGLRAEIEGSYRSLARDAGYWVYFDWDKATLTNRARQIVAEAAAVSTRVAATHIETNGYTDTSGSKKYNQALSMRRAEAVAAELVRDGVPKTAISIHGFGQTHLLVATGPGVREPQNRHVEIIIR